MKTHIIARTDIYDDDDLRDDEITLTKVWDDGKWKYSVICFNGGNYYDDLPSALRAYNDAVYNACI